MASRVHTLGDSTLDNLYWLLDGQGSNLEQAKAASTEGKLQRRLGDNYSVVSHAYDGFTTEDVLGTRVLPIGSVLPRAGGKYITYMSEKASSGAVVRPLARLEENLVEGNNYVVISVGGNDFRENLRNPFRLLRDISRVQNRYLQIVDRVRGLSTETKKVYPILMFQYRTDANEDAYRIYTLFGIVGSVAFVVNLLCIGLILVPLIQVAAGVLTFQVSMVVCPIIGILGLVLSHLAIPLCVSKDILLCRKPSMSLFGSLLERFYQPMLKRAREAHIPILDLPNTFNPYNRLYTSGIEPNAQGSELIAEGIAHIVQNHNFEQASAIYAKTGAHYVGSANTRSWSVAYPRRPSQN